MPPRLRVPGSTGEVQQHCSKQLLQQAHVLTPGWLQRVRVSSDSIPASLPLPSAPQPALAATKPCATVEASKMLLSSRV